jgi:polysaccharide pyruvyl transferase WcaK-like protein
MKIVIVPSEGGYHNIGDEAMFISIVAAIKSRIQDVEIVALTSNPKATIKIEGVKNKNFLQPYLTKTSKNIFIRKIANIIPYNLVYLVRCVKIIFIDIIFKYTKVMLTNNIILHEYVKTIFGCDAIINSGGGNLNDMWLKNELYPRCLNLIIGNIFKKPIFLTGQGIGPLRNKLARKILAYSVAKAKMITVRDYENSKKLLCELGVDDEKIFAIGDDAILLPPAEVRRINSIMMRYNIIDGNGKRFGLHFRLELYAGTEGKFIKKISNMIDQIINEFEAHFILIPMAYGEYEDDRKVLIDIRNYVKNKEKVDVVMEELKPHESKYLIGKLDYAIGLSYHFVQFAMSMGVPTIGMYCNEYYRLKLIGLMQFYNMQKYTISLVNEEIGNVVLMLKKMIIERDIIVQELTSETEMMHLRVSRKTDLIIKQLSHPRLQDEGCK